MLKLRFTAILLMYALAAPAGAQSPAPFKDFTFKRVKIPKSGSKKRINVQIDPSAPEAIPVKPATSPTSNVSPGRYDWFWTTHSPALVDAKPGRLALALKSLANPPSGQSVAHPRLQLLQNIAAAHGRDILLSTVGSKVSPALVLAVIAIESGGKIDALSSAGATGLMQLMPDTATAFGVTDALNPTENIKGGTAFLDVLMKRFQGDPALVLAAYNAGETAIAENNGVPPFPETRDYVPKVLAAWSVARGLCLTPPELLSDGCVFATAKVRKDG